MGHRGHVAMQPSHDREDRLEAVVLTTPHRDASGGRGRNWSSARTYRRRAGDGEAEAEQRRRAVVRPRVWQLPLPLQRFLPEAFSSQMPRTKDDDGAHRWPWKVRRHVLEHREDWEQYGTEREGKEWRG
jgi:hypothetical protein